MLAYVVKEMLAGRAAEIKAFTIAVDVFGRDPSFDPATDSIVRVQAGRLREALASHYAHEGAASPLRIELPKGTYVPAFTHVPAASAPTPAPETAPPPAAAPDPAITPRAPIASLRAYWPLAALIAALALPAAVSSPFVTTPTTPSASHQTPPAAAPRINALMLAAFTALSDAAEDRRFADALTTELATSFARTGLLDLKIAPGATGLAGEELRQAARARNAYWAMTGVLHASDQGRRANVFLMDVPRGTVLWSQDYNLAREREAPDKLADRILLDLRPQIYGAAKRHLDARTDPTPLELFVLSTWSPGVETNSLDWQLSRIALARQAVAADADFGPAHSVLADKLSLLANLDRAYDTDEAWQDAATAARRASVLTPHSSEVAFNLALYHFHAGDHASALKMVKRTLELDPEHTLARIWVYALPYYCKPAPQAAIDALIAFDARLASSNPARWQSKTWLARMHLNNADYAAAIDAARDGMRIVPNFGAALILAVALVQAGDVDAARAVMADQKPYWPGFDFDHYNTATLPRLCASSPLLASLQKRHDEAAKALR